MGLISMQFGISEFFRSQELSTSWMCFSYYPTNTLTISTGN